MMMVQAGTVITGPLTGHFDEQLRQAATRRGSSRLLQAACTAAMSHLMDPSKLRAMLPSLRQNLAAVAAMKKPSGMREPGASVAAVFRWKERERRTLELLFIRRSINEWDTWSGQVAFPGGRRQKKATGAALAEAGATGSEWETTLETAMRETMEEIGLDLSQPHVHWIGRLPTIQTHLRTFFVGTEVFFIDETADTDAFVPVIQQSEIADVFWVDIQELFNASRYQPLFWPLEDMIPLVRKHPMAKSLAKTVLGDLYFGSIYLPRPTHPQPDDDPTPRGRYDFILWGLTMRMVADMFTIAGTPLPMGDDVRPHFQSKRLGDLFLFIHQHPKKALQRGLAAAAACTAIGLVGSRL